MIGTSQLINAFGAPVCFTDTTDIFKDRSGVALYGLDYDASDAGGASGKFGEAAIFNGTSSKISTPITSSNIGTSFTISCWVNVNAASDNYHVAIGNYTPSGGWYLGMNNSMKFVFYNKSGSSTSYYQSTATYQYGQWYHFCVVFTHNSDIKAFINGNEETFSASIPAGTNSNGIQIGVIGTYSSSTNTEFDGKIDQVRIYNTALTSSQVTQLFQENNSTVGTHLLGCIANYNLDGSAKESMGTTAYDGTETDITYRYDGNSTAVDFGVGGKSNYGARFNGSSSKISTDVIPLTNTSFTVSAWVNKDNDTSAMSVFSQGNSGNNNPQIAINFTSDNRIELVNRNNSAVGLVDYVAAATHGITSGSFHHLVVVFTTTTFTVYVNGTSVDNGTFTANTGTFNTQNIGVRQRVLYDAYFNGTIDQFRIFNKAISAAEVSQLYGGGAGEIACVYTATTTDINYPTTNLAYYKLDNNSKDSAKSSGKFNQAAIFNGSSSKIDLPDILPANSYADSSFTCWFKTSDTSGNQQTIVSAWNGSTTANNGGYALFKDVGNVLRLGNYYLNSSASGVDGTTNVGDGNWHFVAIVFDYSAGTLKLFLDGNSTPEITISSLTPGTVNPFNGGAELGYQKQGGPFRYFPGTIDQVRIYSDALDSTDISNLYAETASTANTLSFPSGQTAVATYKLDGDSTDLSGNYNGTDTNVEYAFNGTESNIEYRFGRYGQALKYSGASSNVETTLDNSNFTSDYSISFWVNLDNANTFQNFVGNYTFSPYGGFTFMSRDVGSGVYRFGFIWWYTSGAVYNYVDNNDVVATSGQWAHLVVTKSSGSLPILYVNGTANSLYYRNSVTDHGTTPENFKIGNTLNNNYSAGLIDQVRVFNSELSASQVTQLYNEKPEIDTSNFKAVLYEGNGGTNFVSNVGFKPDLVWVKARDDAHDHVLYDTVRGVGPGKALSSNANYVEGAYDATYGFLDTFESTGFIAKTGSSVANYTNKNNESYAAWCWKAGGDAVFNTDGSITSQVSANTAAGFSIVSYTAGSSKDYTQAVGHGLDSAPEIIIQKRRGTSSSAWYIIFTALDDSVDYMSFDTGSKNDMSGSNSGFTIGTDGFSDWWGSSYNIINYCWHSVPGVSKISTYLGATAGVTENVGFEPSMVIIKNVTQSDPWGIFDNKRPGGTGFKSYLYPSTADDEDVYSGSLSGVTLTSTGFTINNTNSNMVNENGQTFLYMAFK